MNYPISPSNPWFFLRKTEIGTGFKAGRDLKPMLRGKPWEVCHEMFREKGDAPAPYPALSDTSCEHVPFKPANMAMEAAHLQVEIPLRKLTWLAGKSTMNESIYFLLNMQIAQPVMLVFRGVNLRTMDFHWFSIATSWVLSRSVLFDPGILPESLDAQWLRCVLVDISRTGI